MNLMCTAQAYLLTRVVTDFKSCLQKSISQQNNPGGKLATFLAREEADAERRALVRPARRAGIEQMNAVVHFVRRAVGVTEEEPVG